MATYLYVAVVDREPGEANWSVLVPDLPEIASVAERREDWASQAYDAVVSAIEARREDGEELPVPTPLDEVTRDWPQPWRAYPVLVPVDLEQVASVRVEVELEAHLLDRIDAAADELGLTRSRFLAQGALALLAQEAAEAGA